MNVVKTINFIISMVFMLCYAYQFVYIVIPFIIKEKKHSPARLNRFAVLIAARNEENVIGHLIKSIKDQTYPADCIDIYVVADNCTDSTAQVCREAGVNVYERFNKELVGKGYALDFLIEKICESNEDGYYDGYFVFDADNVLEENFIYEMNRTFCDGHNIVTSYRNSKNYGDNWISAGYALWYVRESRFLNNARHLINASCAVSGTGFLFSHSILKECGGWKFFLLTEDIEFSAHNIIKGEKIAFCRGAMLYDEQPVKFRQSWRQRLRWSKGFLQVLRKHGVDLIKGIFRGSYSCYDLAMNIMPAMFLSLACIILDLGFGIYYLSIGESPIVLLQAVLQILLTAYTTLFLVGSIATVTEWDNIYCPTWKKILYAFTFPLFMMTYIPISIQALLTKVEWKPIEHSRSQSLDDIRNSK
ncbi:MAG: glycosyltransferase family 2 protein [Clostridia bacterium]|nr:glycosyltransferase family 2 protein [Clostridia bacterium]